MYVFLYNVGASVRNISFYELSTASIGAELEHRHFKDKWHSVYRAQIDFDKASVVRIILPADSAE